MKPREKIALALADYFLVMAGMAIAVGFRMDFIWNDKMLSYLGRYELMVGVPAAAVLSFYLFGLYEKVWRYAGTHELSRVVLSVTVSMIPFQVVVLIREGDLFPRTGLALAWMVCICLCGGVRLLLRVASESMGRPITNTRVIIVGVNDAGESVVRELTRDARSRYTVVGFVDDNPTHQNVRIRGVPVLGGLAQLPALIDAHLVAEVILASHSPASVRQLMEACGGRQVKFRIVPSVSDMIEGRFELSRLRALSIEDLLEREPIHIDSQAVAEFLKGKTVLITGAGGSIGSEIARQVNRFEPKRLILLGRGENSLHEVGMELPGAELVVCNICRHEALRRCLAECRPQVVFHAAAHKHVPLMEARPCEAVHNNVFGTLGLMEACQEVGVDRFIILSTDKAVDPVSVMGATKRLAELLVAKRGGQGYAAVRFGNVLGSRGSVVPIFRRQIAEGGPITLTSPEMTRYFMTIPEAVVLVLQAGAMAQKGEIYILDMGKPVKIVDLARNLIRLSGFEPDKDIEIRFTGIRPGEKLHEALNNAGEGFEPTKVGKICRVTSPPPGGDWPGEGLEKLRQAAESGDDKVCIENLRALVGNYIPFSEFIKAAARD